MAFVGGPAWALINCLLAQAVTVTASDRSEIRSRVQNDQLEIDGDTRPSLQLVLTTPSAGYAFRYGPSFTVLSFGREDSLLVVSHAFDARMAARWERTTFSLSETATYGTFNFRAQSLAAQPGFAAPPPAGGTPPADGTPGAPPADGTPGMPGTTPPGTTPPGMTPGGPIASSANTQQVRMIERTIRTASSNTTAQLQQVFSPLTVGTLTVGYEYGGGLDTVAQTLLPIRRGPTATTSVMYRADRADDVTTVVNGTYLDTGSTMHAAIVDAHEEWTHRWLPALSTSLGAGVAVARAEANNMPRRVTEAVVPVGRAGLDYRFGYAGGRMRTMAAVQLVPVVDRFTGDLDQRVLWVVDVNWTRRGLSFVGNFSGAQSVLPDVVFIGAATSPFNFYGGSAGVLYRLSTQLVIEGGLRTVWVRTRGDTDSLPLLWSLYAGVTYTLGPAQL